jgi:DNA-binding FadR family transcriptional regulator
LAEDNAVALRRVAKPSTRLRSDVVAAQLKEMILSGELRPGDRLPPEADLCREFGVSRMTIREATQSLKGLGPASPSTESTRSPMSMRYAA